MVISLDESNFDQETSTGVTLVDFYADWCMPCKRMIPKVVSVAEALQGKVTVAKVDVDKQQSLAKKYGVRSIPTFILFENGKPIGHSIGSKTEKDLLLFAEGKRKSGNGV